MVVPFLHILIPTTTAHLALHYDQNIAFFHCVFRSNRDVKGTWDKLCCIDDEIASIERNCSTIISASEHKKLLWNWSKLWSIKVTKNMDNYLTSYLWRWQFWVDCLSLGFSSGRSPLTHTWQCSGLEFWKYKPLTGVMLIVLIWLGNITTAWNHNFTTQSTGKNPSGDDYNCYVIKQTFLITHSTASGMGWSFLSMVRPAHTR